LPREQAGRLAAVGAAVSAGTLSRIWQLTLKAYEEVRRAPDAAAAVDMALIRLAYAADLPGPEEALKRLQAGEFPGAGPVGGGGGGVAGRSATNAVARQPMPSAPPSPEPAAVLNTFEDLLALIDRRRDVTLKMDVERYIRPISFRQGAIEYEPGPGAPVNLAQRLVARLKEWTGERWLIAAQGGGGAESAWEKQRREQREVRAEIEQDPFVRSVMEAFPGAEIIGVRNLAPTPAIEGVAPTEVDDDDEE
jgi:DNA polymerase-3 subunit gamma/tau